ncbi:MAG: four helix bundle protein [Bacteroidota bacterium]
MRDNFDQLKTRTQKFALSIIEFTKKMGNDQASKVLSNQLLRAGTSVGANYRAACRARSKAEFISKITIVEEEADECGYWLELIDMAKLMNHEMIVSLKKEASELTAIFTASGKTAKDNR